MSEEAELDNNITKIRAECEELEKKLRDSRDDLEKIRASRNDADSIKWRVDSSERELQNKEDELKEKTKRLEVLKSSGATSGDSQQASDLKKKIADVDTQIADIKKKIDEAEADAKKLEALKSRATPSTPTAPSLTAIDLGLRFQPLASDHVLAGRFYVESVAPGSLASSKGIQEHDIVMKIDGQDGSELNAGDLNAKAKLNPGATSRFEVYRPRGGGFLKLDITFTA
eukprot:CAMPEP_0113672264 /NCGR_PEP_ID=MMETSP0038_2-20120614/6162_1 /TAXON_ID=2898 /ORGANISM="Cryptomonas paramecium" /LENGTH=227 /DNA_ID=CAMNT_0000588505 /DNA_START=58 /DNA_END=741 /DNA_ORIENTATION=- /assembly_acc=CAM_ASM_000170